MDCKYIACTLCTCTKGKDAQVQGTLDHKRSIPKGHAESPCDFMLRFQYVVPKKPDFDASLEAQAQPLIHHNGRQ